MSYIFPAMLLAIALSGPFAVCAFAARAIEKRIRWLFEKITVTHKLSSLLFFMLPRISDIGLEC
jgi:hypothetical protein